MNTQEVIELIPRSGLLFIISGLLMLQSFDLLSSGMEFFMLDEEAKILPLALSPLVFIMSLLFSFSAYNQMEKSTLNKA